jgi:pilus assembly protein Flp/PilA
MKALGNAVKRFFRDEQGTETLEWGLICGLIVVGAITVLTLVGPKVTQMWNTVGDKVSGAADKVGK